MLLNNTKYTLLAFSSVNQLVGFPPFYNSFTPAIPADEPLPQATDYLTTLKLSRYSNSSNKWALKQLWWHWGAQRTAMHHTGTCKNKFQLQIHGSVLTSCQLL